MQKTAYEMRISDWSSYVCSSDLGRGLEYAQREEPGGQREAGRGHQRAERQHRPVDEEAAKLGPRGLHPPDFVERRLDADQGDEQRYHQRDHADRSELAGVPRKIAQVALDRPDRTSVV